MSEQQVWRIVDATAAVREVRVRAGHSALGGVGYFADFGAADAMTFAPAQREAVLRLAAAHRVMPAEILAPGEMTRAEAVAAARREGAEAMRAAANTAALDAVESAGLDADLPLDAHCAVTAAVRHAIRALPLPGDATPEHATLPAPVCPAPTGAL